MRTCPRWPVHLIAVVLPLAIPVVVKVWAVLPFELVEGAERSRRTSKDICIEDIIDKEVHEICAQTVSLPACTQESPKATHDWLCKKGT